MHSATPVFISPSVPQAELEAQKKQLEDAAQNLAIKAMEDEMAAMQRAIHLAKTGGPSEEDLIDAAMVIQGGLAGATVRRHPPPSS